MQQLVFHPAWDKTIAEQDRKEIVETFKDIQLENEPPIQMTVLKEAFNYKGELLVTGIIHNLTESDYSPDGDDVIYQKNEEKIAEKTFSIADLVIKGKTSTPWTFIFPEDAIMQRPLSNQPGQIMIQAKSSR